MKRLAFGFLFVVLASAAAAGQEFPVQPYADPAQLDVPWPKHSFSKQPWRGFVETRSGYDFLHGIGVNYHVPGNDPLAVRLLAEAGFKTFRIEIGFGNVNWDEKGLANEERMRKLLALCKQYDIRPTMLLNAHQGVPCPLKFFTRRLLADAPRGSREVRLDDTRDLVVGRSGLNGLSDYWAAEALITQIDERTGACRLSKPLPKDLKAGERTYGHARLRAAVSRGYGAVRRHGRRLGPLCAARLPAGPRCGYRRLRRGDLERVDLRHAVPRRQQLLRPSAAEDRPRARLPQPRRQLLGACPAHRRGRKTRASPSPLHLGLLQHHVLPLPDRQAAAGHGRPKLPPLRHRHAQPAQAGNATRSPRFQPGTVSRRRSTSACPKAGRTPSCRPNA